MHEDIFYEKYHPVKNHLLESAPWDDCMFETFGEEVQYVCDVANNPDTAKKVWTIVEDGGLSIIAGYHYVNRLGYLITEEDWEDEMESYECEEVKEFDVIFFKDQEYACRVLDDGLVADEKLLDVLEKDENGYIVKDTESEQIDNSILYYASVKDLMELSDEEFMEIIY